MKRKLLSIIPVLILCMGLFSVTAMAETEPPVSYVEYSWDEATSTLSSEEKSVTEYALVSENPTKWGEWGTTSWYVVEGNVDINSRVEAKGQVNLILTDGCRLTVNGGITVNSSDSLTIYGQEESSGMLIASGAENSAGIGGNANYASCGTVTVHGGSVDARGGTGSAGIGGARDYLGNGGNFTIYHGSVYALAGGAVDGVTAIGTGGGSSSCGNTKIYGGTVTAESYTGPAIGGSGIAGSILIAGGVVNASYLDSSSRESAVIGGHFSYKPPVTITGGVVNITKGNANACIGNKDNENNVTITGGIVYRDDIGTVYGETTLKEDMEIPTGKGLMVPEDAKLIIPAGVTLTNNGTLQIAGESSLAVIGNLQGGGGFVLQTDFTVPDGLVYTGQDLTNTAKGQITLSSSSSVTIKEILFTAPANYTIAPEVVKDAGEYTVTYGTQQKTFSVANAALKVTAETRPLTYNGQEQVPNITINVETVDGSSAKIMYGWKPEAGNGSYTTDLEACKIKDAGTRILRCWIQVDNHNQATVSLDIVVNPLELNEQNTTVQFSEMTYNGQPRTPTATVTIDGLSGTGSWSEVTNVTDQTTFTADGNFTGSIGPISPGMQPNPVTAEVTAQNKYWDGTDAAEVTVTADTGINGETLTISGVTATFSDSEVDDGKTVALNKTSMSITYSNGKPENYMVTVPDTATAGIRIIPLTITGVKMDADSYTYGDTVSYDNTALTVTQPGGMEAKAEDLVYTYTGTANDGTEWNDTAAPAKAGSYTLTVSHRDTVHYSGAQSVSFTINKAPATVTAKNQSYHIGTQLPDRLAPELGKHYTVDGLFGEDRIGTVTMKYQKDGEEVTPDSSKTGTYDIIMVVTDVNPNYEVSLVSGKLTYYYTSPATYRPTIEKSEGGETTVNNQNPERGDRVTITAKPDVGYQVGEVIVTDRNGSEVEVTDNGDGTYSFKQPSGKVNIEVMYVLKQHFTDVSENAYYFDAVLWALDEGITSGTTATTFSPNNPCTRAQMATFLWRAAGSPEPKGDSNSFADVNEGAYYAKAVQWAYEQGITGGTSATTYSPNAPCTRAQMAAFIYRNEQANGNGFTGAWMFRIPFADAPEWAYESIAWCYKEGITSGTSSTTFSPDDPCTRAQMVTFLYRCFGE